MRLSFLLFLIIKLQPKFGSNLKQFQKMAKGLEKQHVKETSRVVHIGATSKSQEDAALQIPGWRKTMKIPANNL